MGKLWIFFRADLTEGKKRFPSWAGAEKFAVDLNFGEKKRYSCCDWSRNPTDRSDKPSLRSRVLRKLTIELYISRNSISGGLRS